MIPVFVQNGLKQLTLMCNLEHNGSQDYSHALRDGIASIFTCNFLPVPRRNTDSRLGACVPCRSRTVSHSLLPYDSLQLYVYWLGPTSGNRQTVHQITQTSAKIPVCRAQFKCSKTSSLNHVFYLQCRA